MSFTGTWTLSIKTPMGEQKPVFDVTQEGSVLTGTMTNPGAEPAGIKDGSIDGNTATWKSDVKTPFPMTLTFKVTVDGDSFSGECKPGMFPASAVSGVRG